MLYSVETNRVVARDQHNNLAGEMVWSMVDSQTIDVTHTEVKEAYRGQGVAHSLMDELINYVASQGIKVIPSCPFVSAQFAANESYQAFLKM